MTNATYTDFPFTVKGINFISRVYSHSEMLKTILSLPAGIFETMNQEAVSEIIGDPSLLTNDELLTELDRVNEGGTHAFILLGENN
jgi:hypothetical protein